MPFLFVKERLHVTYAAEKMGETMCVHEHELALGPVVLLAPWCFDALLQGACCPPASHFGRGLPGASPGKLRAALATASMQLSNVDDGKKLSERLP